MNVAQQILQMPVQTGRRIPDHSWPVDMFKVVGHFCVNESSGEALDSFDFVHVFLSARAA